jgi:hypothetical protein
MIKGDRFQLFGHEMEVILRKETLDTEDGVAKDLFIYDLACTCHSYPKHLTMNVTEDTLNLMLKYEENGIFIGDSNE